MYATTESSSVWNVYQWSEHGISVARSWWSGEPAS